MSEINLFGENILITGSAGFIGSALTQKLLSEGFNVIGIDNLNEYYDVNLKLSRLETLKKYNNFKFIKCDISDKILTQNIFNEINPFIVVNLAAQAGVRYSIENPDAYINSNIMGFYNILEACRHSKNLRHLIFASSSSVYGADSKIPFSTSDMTDHPVSLYAATKKSNELLAYAYNNLYKIQMTGLRFFTVYGPSGRPDMAYFKFADKLISGKKIQIFNYGNCERDFTYIDDIVNGIFLVMKHQPENFKIYNIGRGKPENLMEFVKILCDEMLNANLLDENFNLNDHIELLPMQAGDVPITYADTSELEKNFNFKPKINLCEGLKNFVKWYADYYRSK